MSKEDKMKDELDLETKKKQDGEMLDEDEDLEEGEEEGEEKKERTFSQRQVNKMLAKEKKSIKTSILKELGLDKVDSDNVENFVSLLSGSNKKKENKEEKRVKEMENKIRELEEKNAEAELKSNILENGISKKYSSVATLLIKQKLGEDEDLTIEDIMKDLQQEYPEWFEEAQDESKNKSYGTGRQVAKSNIKKSSAGSPNSISARLIEARKQEQSSQKTYEGWKNDL